MSMRRGVTLVEVMVVVAILGVMASLAGVALSEVVGRARQARDADLVEELLRQTRNVARNQHRCVEVSMETDLLRIVPLRHPPHTTPPDDCAGGSAIANAVIERRMPAGVRLQQMSFFFDRAGGIFVTPGEEVIGGGVTIPITVTNAGGTRTFLLRILAGTGAITRTG